MQEFSSTQPAPPWTFTLRWRGTVDLDLMAFYVTSAGDPGGVFAEAYAGQPDGTMRATSRGATTAFPFLKLSEDQGRVGQPGEYCEQLTMERVDHLAELVVCAVNVRPAAPTLEASTAVWEATLEVSDSTGVFHSQPLEAPLPGAALVLCLGAAESTGWQWSFTPRPLSLPQLQALAPGASSVALDTKVTIEASGDSAAIAAPDDGEILVHLRWTPRPTASGLLRFFSRSNVLDLDLGCFFELANGDRAAIQPLNDGFFKSGSFHEAPWIYHQGDDRSGSRQHGELLRINAQKWSEIRRILVFAFLYEGAPRWSESDAVLTIQAAAPMIEIPLGQHPSSAGFCAAALLENEQGQIKATKLVTFHEDHPQADQFYGWGMNWGLGEKPV